MKRTIAEHRGVALSCAAGALLMALAACGGSSTVAAAPATLSPEPAVSPVVAKPSPASPPVTTAVIPGLTQAFALQIYVDQGFDCLVVRASHPTWVRHRCSKTSGTALATVDVEGPGTAVAYLKASTVGMPDAVNVGFLGDSASLPFDGSASDQALQWVSDAISGGGGATIIGGVKLQLAYNPPFAWVTLKPAG
jgi:hypothetical protein